MPLVDRTIIETLEAMLQGRTLRLEVPATEIETSMLRGEIKMLRVVMQEIHDMGRKMGHDS